MVLFTLSSRSISIGLGENWGSILGITGGIVDLLLVSEEEVSGNPLRYLTGSIRNGNRMIN